MFSANFVKKLHPFNIKQIIKEPNANPAIHELLPPFIIKKKLARNQVRCPNLNPFPGFLNMPFIDIGLPHNKPYAIFSI